MKKIFKAIDLFAGIGGIRLGFEQAFRNQIKFVYSNEIDDYACKVYEANFKENPKGDITQLDLQSLPEFDLLLAGFPCQAFSIAGKKRGFDDIRGTLFFYVAEILRLKRPAAFLLENVKHLLHHDGGKTFQIIQDVLRKDLGYYIKTKVLNAVDFGIPQKRKRLLIIGFREDLEFKFPYNHPNQNKPSIRSILEQEQVDTKFYLSKTYWNGLKAHKARHKRKGNGFGYQIIDKDGIANTIVCGGMGKERNLIHDQEYSQKVKAGIISDPTRNSKGIRKMTPNEWQLLQGFPRNFQLPVSMTRKYKLLANSVAVPVIRAVAMQMKFSLKNKIPNRDHISLGEIQEQIIELCFQLYQKHEISKTRRKYIKSLERFIEQKCLRIPDLNLLLKKMEDFGLIEIISEKQIKLQKIFLASYSFESFKQNLLEIILNEGKESIMDTYMQKGIISINV